MNVNLLFFGATADSAGVRSVELDLPGGIQADQALDRIFLRFPSLAVNHDRNSLHFSINQVYSTGNELIEDGDELALFTAVSGG